MQQCYEAGTFACNNKTTQTTPQSDFN